MYDLNSPIAAVATAPGQGGIGIIRLSGQGLLEILSKVFKRRYPPSEAWPETLPEALPETLSSGPTLVHKLELKPWVLHRGWVLDEYGQELDDALAVFMPGPRTFTGEDCAEIHCHGGRFLLKSVLQAVLKAGARCAEAGEFSYRAFVNERIDLSQAEAVAELIGASSKQGLRLAKAKLEGALGQKISVMTQSLRDMQARLCLWLDFSLELSGAEAETPARAELEQGLSGLLKELHSLAKAYERARAWREGALVVLAGPVNAGKSSLMNAILGRKRSLVGPTPGTTRDYIEENLDLEGLPTRLVDTAGLRETSDAVEAEGVSLARELAAQADFILLLRDCSQPQEAEEAELLAKYPNKSLLILNKADLLVAELPESEQGPEQSENILYISAKSGQGLDELLQTLRRKLLERLSGTSTESPEKLELVHDNTKVDNVQANSIQDGSAGIGDLAPNLRQAQLIEAAATELESLLHELNDSTPLELLSVRLDIAANHLAEIVGGNDIDRVVENIFKNFCIGK